MQVPALKQKHKQSPPIVILKAVCRFVFLHLSTFSGFSIFSAGFAFAFAFAFGNFARYCVVLLNAPSSDRDKKTKRVSNGLLFPGNYDPSSLTPGSPVAPLVCSFRRRDNLLAWRELFAILYELKSRIDFGRNTTSLSKFIRYIDLTDFRQISPKHSSNNEKRKRVGKFWYLKYLSCYVHLRNTSRIFFATPT